MKKNHTRGIILVDILLAMTLGIIFIVLITQSSQNSRDLFEFAKERNRLLDVYETHASEFENMVPYESRTSIVNADGWNYFTTTITGYAHWYGNDRIQTDITINQSLTFNSIRAYPFLNINDTTGTPLCSVDFSNTNTVGSYGFTQQVIDQQEMMNQINLNPQQLSVKPNPQTLNPKITPIILPIDPLLPLTDLQVRNGKAYVSTDSTKQSDPDILIVDIHDSAHANLTASLNTGPGISAITLVGNRIFAAVTSRTAQLQVIHMPTMDSVIIESSYKLPLPYATATPALGSAIFYDKNRIYLGTEKWDGEEFNIIDVSNPAQPEKIGGIETGSKVGAIFVREGIAYSAASDEKQFRAIDVRNSTSPVLLDSFSPSGWERQEGKSLSFFEDGLEFGRTSGGFNIKQDHELFAWGTSTITGIQKLNNGMPQNFLAPSISDSLLNTPAPNSVDISGGVYGVISDRSFIYTATRQLDREFQIFDHNLSTTTAKTISLPVAPQMLTCDGDNLYILAATAPVIYQISFK